MKKIQYAQFVISAILSIFLFTVCMRSQRYIHDYELKRINELGVIIAETERRKLIIEMLIREEEQYCDGMPWQEDSLWVANHWNAIHSMYFADTITLSMIDSFRNNSFFKINLPPEKIETEATFCVPSGAQKRISL